MATTNSTQSVYGTQYRGAAPENYERYFVPVIARPSSMWRAAPVSSRGLQPSVSDRRVRLSGST